MGGFIQVSTFSQSKHVEFVVADAGMGIARSLGIRNNRRSIEEAIKEGVTRNKKTNAGNGLFGSFQIATLSGGDFKIQTGPHSFHSTKEFTKFYSTKPVRGTIVAARIDCSQEDLLERALRFDDLPHTPPYDYIEKKYETVSERVCEVKMSKESASFGSRESAKPLKTKISNLLGDSDTKVVLDFSEVYVISSSFADEVFGRLFSELGPIAFMSRLEFRNVDRTIHGLIDRAIKQRLTSSLMPQND